MVVSQVTAFLLEVGLTLLARPHSSNAHLVSRLSNSPTQRVVVSSVPATPPLPCTHSMSILLQFICCRVFGPVVVVVAIVARTRRTEMFRVLFMLQRRHLHSSTNLYPNGLVFACIFSVPHRRHWHRHRHQSPFRRRTARSRSMRPTSGIGEEL